MKKIISLILAVMMILSMTACGASSAKDTSSAAPAAPAATTEATKAPEPQVELGTVSDNVYQNKFLGLACKLDSDWEFYSDEQMRELNDLTMDALDEDIAKKLESANVVQDMYANNATTGESLNLNLENLGLLYGTVMSEDAYVEASLPQLAPALESMGLENVVSEKVTVTVAGVQHPAIHIHGNLSGFDFYETIVCVKQGKHMANITAGSAFEDTTAQILEHFFAL